MKHILFVTTTLAAMAWVSPASATLVSSASSTTAGLSAGCNTTDGGSGTLTTSCSGGGFSAIALSAGGPPLLSVPDLSATTLTVTTTPLVAATTLTVDIASSGFSFAGGPLSALLTVNNLIGAGTGPFVLSAVTPAGSVTRTFTGSGAETGGPTVFPAFTTDSAHFVLTFAASALPQSIDATIEIVGATEAYEPGSLALFGVGLLGTVVLSQRRRWFL
jgi:hypothetical protein